MAADTRTRPRTGARPPRGPVDGGWTHRRLTLGDIPKRGMILLVATAIVLTLFAGRLVELQVFRGPSLASAALDQRLKTTALPAARGAILDAAGDPLAVTVEARNVTADQTLIDDPAAAAARLAPILGVDAAELTPRLTGERRFVYIAKMITPETWNRIADMGVPGIFSETTSRRVYPGGELAANIVGFVGAEGVGMGGLEYALEKELAGTAGEQTYEKGLGGRVIPTANVDRVDPQPGMDVQLTIDRDIQFVAQEAIAQTVRNARAASGTVVVMEVKSGRILAMATAPTFNANDPGSAEPANRGNRVLTDVFEPGSTGKVITLAGVVNEGAANPYTVIKVPPRLRRGGESFQDHTPHGTLRLTLSGIMAQSSNIGTILAAERIGREKLYDYMKRFGIGEKTGINFPAEGKGYVPPVEDWSATSMPTIAFGQGLSVNAVQAANVYATVANGGVRQDPRLIDAFISPTGEVITPESGERTRVISRVAANQVLTMLETVVGDGGTAPLAKIPGYRVGGKTGTAMFIDPRCGCYTNDVVASFIGVAPIDDPELVVAVFVSQPRSGRYGGQLGGPVFKRVMTYSLQARQIPPTGTRAPRIPLTAKG